MDVACVCDCIISVCRQSHTKLQNNPKRISLFFSVPPPPLFSFFKFPLVLPPCFVECSPLSSMRSPVYIWKGLFCVCSHAKPSLTRTDMKSNIINFMFSVDIMFNFFFKTKQTERQKLNVITTKQQKAFPLN